jgi:DNA-binding MarR family transcriptional regulator
VTTRGIFHCFLRYITLTLRHWQVDGKGPIDTTIAKEAAKLERLGEDMERELAELFPKQSDLRLQAVRLLMRLEESGAKKQTHLAEELGMEDCAMSRLLAGLELHRRVARRR